MFNIIIRAVIASLKSRNQLALENIALRHQLEILQRNAKRPRLKPSDRALWAVLSRFLVDWRRHLTIIQPDTVIRWHRTGWRLYWKWISKPGRGRPKISAELRALIRRMSLENPLWGAPRVHGELLKLSYDVCESTIANYMVRRTGPASQTWRTFIRNHMTETVAIDFLTVHTTTFKTLYVFVILSLDRRRVLKEYLAYYHESRTHLGLEKDAPVSRSVQTCDAGRVISEPVLGGLHHRYFRVAA